MLRNTLRFASNNHNQSVRLVFNNSNINSNSIKQLVSVISNNKNNLAATSSSSTIGNIRCFSSSGYNEKSNRLPSFAEIKAVQLDKYIAELRMFIFLFFFPLTKTITTIIINNSIEIRFCF